ncbi:MAG: hypothetical protein ABI452_00300, partial [Candidatus Limnocylindrales bacterium]
PTATPAPTATVASTAGYSCDPDMTYGCDASPSPGTGSPAPAGDTVSVSATDAYLVGPTGMTLYVFDHDSANISACTSSDCAGAWPALTVDAGASPSAGDGATGTLTTFDRGGGIMQVQYNDRPLYYFIGDAAPGDTSGDGTNGVWHLATP